jgi:hypothetical protein
MQAVFKGLVLGGHDPAQLVSVIVTNPDQTVGDLSASIGTDGSFTVSYTLPMVGNYSAYAKLNLTSQYSGGASSVVTFNGTTPLIVQTLTLSVEVTN